MNCQYCLKSIKKNFFNAENHFPDQTLSFPDWRNIWIVQLQHEKIWSGVCWVWSAPPAQMLTNCKHRKGTCWAELTPSLCQATWNSWDTWDTRMQVNKILVFITISTLQVHGGPWEGLPEWAAQMLKCATDTEMCHWHGRLDWRTKRDWEQGCRPML